MIGAGVGHANPILGQEAALGQLQEDRVITIDKCKNNLELKKLFLSGKGYSYSNIFRPQNRAVVLKKTFKWSKFGILIKMGKI